MRYNIRMAIIVMLGWWYGRGWLWVLRSIGTNLSRISQIFAVKVLLKTWFAPWKQIYTPSNFRNFFQIAIDNSISRLIGGIVRTAMLLCALVLAILAVVFGVILAILWPLLPVSIVLLPVLALGGDSL